MGWWDRKAAESDIRFQISSGRNASPNGLGSGASNRYSYPDSLGRFQPLCLQVAEGLISPAALALDSISPSDLGPSWRMFRPALCTMPEQIGRASCRERV